MEQAKKLKYKLKRAVRGWFYKQNNSLFETVS